MLDGEGVVCYNKGKYRGAERLFAFNALFRDNAEYKIDIALEMS